jgi:hypothetical protein
VKTFAVYSDTWCIFVKAPECRAGKDENIHIALAKNFSAKENHQEVVSTSSGKYVGLFGFPTLIQG